jgi:small subunit ribosomal protein S6
MNNYETMVIVDAMISDDAINRELNTIQSKIETAGEVVRIDNWGKRKMAYTIQKKSHGHYTVFYYKAEASVARDLEKDFRINENVLRWLTLKDHPMTDVVYGQDIADEEGSAEVADDSDEDTDNETKEEDKAEE